LVAMENYAVALADAHRYREAAEVVRDLIERAQATPRELALIVPLEQRIARALEAEGESHAAGSRATETPRR